MANQYTVITVSSDPDKLLDDISILTLNEQDLSASYVWLASAGWNDDTGDDTIEEIIGIASTTDKAVELVRKWVADPYAYFYIEKLHVTQIQLH